MIHLYAAFHLVVFTLLSHTYYQARADLITLDSPFIDDPANIHPSIDASASKLTESVPSDDFEDAWDNLDDQSGARGWYASSMDNIVRLLQGVQYARLTVTPTDRPPFEGLHM
jgi:hypothetical protein